MRSSTLTPAAVANFLSYSLNLSYTCVEFLDCICENDYIKIIIKWAVFMLYIENYNMLNIKLRPIYQSIKFIHEVVKIRKI